MTRDPGRTAYRDRTRAPIRRPRRRALALGLAALLALTGCTAVLPTDPVPHAGLPVDVQPRQDVQRLLPRPQPGASPEDIVRGFLRANVGFAEDDDVARDYLTSELASSWVPTRNVLVIDGSPELSASEPGIVTVTATVRGRIDERGRLVQQPRGTTTTQTFQLSPVQGEWRIGTFPDDFGLWLSPQDLDTAFRAYRVYYLNPVLDLYVPDVRWLARGEGLYTSLTRAQLEPVPPYLQGAVVTGADEDVRLAVGAVPMDPQTQVATVNIVGPGLAEDAEQIEELRAQLAHALLSLSGVSGLDLRIGGRSVGEEDGDPVTAATDVGYQDVDRVVDRAFLRVQRTLVAVDTMWYDLRNATPVPPRSTLPRVDQTYTGLAASEDLSTFAAVSQDRRELWRWSEGTEAVHPGIGDRLTDPTYDPHGLLWVAGVVRGGTTPRLWFVESDDIKALARPLDVDVLGEGERIRTFRVSPDGTRALMVVGTDEETPEGADAPADGGRLLVAGIVRDATGLPTGLSTPAEIAPALTSVTSARWATTTEVVVVGQRDEDQQPRPFRVPLGGWLADMGTLPGLVDVIAIPQGDTYTPVLRTEDGRFHTTERSSWYVARNGDELVVPGT